ncbi:MAG: cytochrome-c oxidase, cbb3-type subunit III [Hyphomicrobiaceae bacterium]
MSKKHIDEVSGIETTSHVWDDDIRELNNPLPRWWLWTFYACILWAFGFWYFYPAWPTMTGYTKGSLNYSERANVAAAVSAARTGQDAFRKQLEASPLGEVRKNPELLRFATAAGSASFQTNCAPCHGRGAQGAISYPNLNDDDWLWGGTVEDIEKTIMYGIRSDHKDTRVSQMPRFGVDKILKPDEIDASVEYVSSLTKPGGDAAKVAKGKTIFAEQCVSCHGPDGKGLPEMGAPNLTDAISLYGNDAKSIRTTIENGRGGMMPAWADRLDKTTVKSLAVYIHSLGGGKQ